MSWFGWLTKPHLEVTALDRITGWAEAFAVVGVIFVACLIAEEIMRRLK